MHDEHVDDVTNIQKYSDFAHIYDLCALALHYRVVIHKDRESPAN